MFLKQMLLFIFTKNLFHLLLCMAVAMNKFINIFSKVKNQFIYHYHSIRHIKSKQANGYSKTNNLDMNKKTIDAPKRIYKIPKRV